MLQIPRVLLTFDKVHNPLRLQREATTEPPKVVRAPGVFNIWASKCASRHNGVHFFDITTSKSGPNLVCFVHFDLEICFAPQRRALFRHLNFQKWSDTEVFCTFWLRNVLRATTACNFSSLIWPAGSAPATLASLLSTLRSHKSLEKHSVSRLSYLFAHLHLLSSDSFSSTLLSSNLSLLSASALLCFSSVHIVGSLTSKLPSIMITVTKTYMFKKLSIVCASPGASAVLWPCPSCPGKWWMWWKNTCSLLGISGELMYSSNQLYRRFKGDWMVV